MTDVAPRTSFDVNRVNACLASTLFHGRLEHFASIDSTNTRAVQQAQAGAPAGTVYIADEQTAGRGRGGHTWHSEPDRGLYLTALVRPTLPIGDALKLSLSAGIAACRAIHDVTGVTIDVRWPNDLVTLADAASGTGGPSDPHRSRKLGGILTESASGPDGALRYAAIGLGINLNQVDFPAELAEFATSLRLASAFPHNISREAIAAALLQHLDRELKLLEAEVRGETVPQPLFARFTQVSTWVGGKRVQVAEDDGYTGVTAGLTREGLLRVRLHDGSERVVRHGGVREARD